MSSSAHFSAPSTVSNISDANNSQSTPSAFVSTTQEHNHAELAHYGHPQAFNHTTEFEASCSFRQGPLPQLSNSHPTHHGFSLPPLCMYTPGSMYLSHPAPTPIQPDPTPIQPAPMLHSTSTHVCPHSTPQLNKKPASSDELEQPLLPPPAKGKKCGKGKGTAKPKLEPDSSEAPKKGCKAGAVDETNPLRGTVVHLAGYPTGYHKVTNEDLIAFSDILTASGQGTSIYSQSWICSESANGNAASTSSAIGLHQNAAIPAQPQASTSADHTIGGIMQANDQWRYPLAHIRMLIRIAVCCGATPNPHLLALTTERGQRVEIIHQLWPLSLMRSEVDPSTLETVLSKVTKKPLSQNDILDFAVPWFLQFSYDVRCKLHDTLDDSRTGFGLGDGAYGDVLIDKILDCARMFIRPWANMLPLSIAKEIVYHVVFRSQETCNVRLTIADLEPAKFCNAPHPPWEALTFFASSCYEVLLKRLSHYPNCDTLLATFPCPSQVFSELKEMGPILLQQHNDPDIQLFRQTLRSLTLITETDVYRISRPKKKK
ncbi:uncharacterized protein HD556DRAFT_1449539 [Suillus plorans]|uniref:Uncharacterized protein n=1 Tax=Suillus plorans TaxID=116603 RepID=A0A9P7AEC7_9AGAM|nr:uncharacterized protein HD556DRAFT_1449539 [Suillus plorans]KAG1786591.1 hypothetical protein HD556DRAFT_1449539 [Suillus plorans]